MAYTEMDKVPINEGEQKQFAFEKSQSLAAVADGDWILIPDDIRGLAVSVSFTGSAEGKVQTTTDPVATVKSGSPTAVDWDAGVVGATTIGYCKPVTAIRASQTSVGGGSGTMKMTIRAQ